MNCRKVRKNLVMFLDGELPPSEAEILRQHLRECEKCRQEAELLRSTLDLAIQRTSQKSPPSVAGDFGSVFWRRAGAESAKRVSARGLVPSLLTFGRVRRAVGSIAAVALVGLVILVVLRGGKAPAPRVPGGTLAEPKIQKPVSPVNDQLAQIEKRLRQLEEAVSNLRVASPHDINFTASEMREIYAAIGLAAANNYRDILNMNDIAAQRYAEVAHSYPETSAGREAKQILSRLN
jgi:anti-sigma factor RsiW